MCMWLHTGSVRTQKMGLHSKLTLGAKSLASQGTRTRVSIANGFLAGRSTNWATLSSEVATHINLFVLWQTEADSRQCPVSRPHTYTHTQLYVYLGYFQKKTACSCFCIVSICIYFFPPLFSFLLCVVLVFEDVPPVEFMYFVFNPFTAPAVKCPGWKMHRLACKQYMFRSCNTLTFTAVRFDEYPFTCQ